ncbi:hypothetical protein MAPG_08824 [Magnaporthiopsis poae ATCC 64411]|uniref:Uncharacterized protein n=1 Tax=Magnaporthiopsis poae (strain ATCC 64411 / 73-15) TaxID=644358 RepID=A0A0C4E8C4_MAGP6|nr:hypothetical protein MAPG_08824 [Magnaporthiopsis poae ATCC 64411]
MAPAMDAAMGIALNRLGQGQREQCIELPDLDMRKAIAIDENMSTKILGTLGDISDKNGSHMGQIRAKRDECFGGLLRLPSRAGLRVPLAFRRFSKAAATGVFRDGNH